MSTIDHLESQHPSSRGSLQGATHRTEIVGQVGEGVAVATFDGTLTYVNAAWAEMHGYISDELIGRNLSVFHTPRQMADDVQPFNNNVIETGRFQGEVGHVTRDGVEFPTLMTTTLLRDGRGVPVEMVAIARDISRAKHIEQEQALRGRFLACLSEVSQLLIGASDLAATLPRVLRILGETAGVSRTYIFSNHSGTGGELLCDLVAQWSPLSLPRRPTEDSGLHDLPYAANGLARWIEILGSGRHLAASLADLPVSERIRLEPYGIQSLLLIPLFVNNAWYGYIGFDSCEKPRTWSEPEIDLLQIAAAEISSALENQNLLTRLEHEALRLEDRVAERTAELSAVNRELEAFAYSVSHDLRAPLRSIGGFSRALLEDYGHLLDDQGRDFLERIGKAHKRMGHLIDNLLQLSRLVGRETINEPLDLSKIARSVVSDLRDGDPQRAVEIDICEGLVATGDAQLMRIALQNLFENAWKFTARVRGARIDFGLEPGAGAQTYRISDNGVGFDQRYAQRLFTPFQRLHDPREYEGTGVGLAIVQRVIHRHGGRIWGEGKVGDGAAFYFTLREKD